MNQQRSFITRKILVTLFFMLAVMVPLAGQAATFTVNTQADPVSNSTGTVCETAPGSGICSLRAAIQSANASLASADTIILPAGTYVLAVAGTNEDAAATGDLDIDGLGGAITITGAGAATTIIDGNAADRVFDLRNAGSLTATGVTIRNGHAIAPTDAGGAIDMGANTTLNLTNAILTGNTADREGGAIANGGGTITMDTVTISSNSPGAINNGDPPSSLTIRKATINNNTVDAAISNRNTLVMENVTLSNNTSTGGVAALDNAGSATLTNITVSGNAAAAGVNNSAIRATATVSIKNSIIAGNTPSNCGNTPLNSQGNNLDSAATCLVTPVAGDLTTTDPLLLALADNGGTLQTQALQPTSPAIDAASPTGCPATDARLIPRPVDGNPSGAVSAVCDMGAFEFRPRKITITPASPLDFGTITSGTTMDKAVTVSNGGDADLLMGTVAAADALASPFLLTANTCSGATLAPAASCNLTLRFAPISGTPATDTFDIPSNDPLTPSVTFTATGAGTATLVPNIAVADTMAPGDDLKLIFGSVAVGSTADATITLTSNGTAAVSIGAVGSANPAAAPFSIISDTCSNKSVAPSVTCTLTVRFAPTTNAASSDTFDIPNNDPDTPTITIAMTGSGLSAAGNNPPSVPVLVSPENGATVTGTTATLIWQRSTDPDGDVVTYHVSNCADAGFTGCTPVDVASAGMAGSLYAALGSLGAGVMMIGFVFGGGLGRSRKMLLMIGIVFLAAGLFVSCSGGGDDDTPAAPTETQHVASGLTPGTTYYWKVVADDGKGGLSESAVRSYTAQ